MDVPRHGNRHRLTQKLDPPPCAITHTGAELCPDPRPNAVNSVSVHSRALPDSRERRVPSVFAVSGFNSRRRLGSLSPSRRRVLISPGLPRPRARGGDTGSHLHADGAIGLRGAIIQRDAVRQRRRSSRSTGGGRPSPLHVAACRGGPCERCEIRPRSRLGTMHDETGHGPGDDRDRADRADKGRHQRADSARVASRVRPHYASAPARPLHG